MAEQVGLFSDQTQLLLDQFALSPSHALIIEGEVGTGTHFAAQHLLQKLSINDADTIQVTSDKSTISVDEIRPLYRLTKSVRDSRLAVVIDNAELMGEDAQNTLLKLLEEPPSNVVFILTTHAYQRLLPTIRSRSATISLRSVSRDQSERLLDQYVLSPEKRARILFLASGKAAELTRMATNDVYYDSCVNAITDAKAFLEADAYQRLVQIKQYAASREKAVGFLSMLATLVTHMIYKDASITTIETSDAIQQALSRLERNANPRAQLLLLCHKLG